ncbi:hypothetical protein CRM22_001020 [Opisthorchis felineus]|uniref:Uncharacterized protein n=1 Tax=Opisthorchis felineus TaxID=147828 RepID=A0A4S2MCH2_OPIFE|nr:hypothetical protein CRM22_001020 [Opisthorchis felineus]
MLREAHQTNKSFQVLSGHLRSKCSSFNTTEHERKGANNSERPSLYPSSISSGSSVWEFIVSPLRRHAHFDEDIQRNSSSKSGLLCGCSQSMLKRGDARHSPRKPILKTICNVHLTEFVALTSCTDNNNKHM